MYLNKLPSMCVFRMFLLTQSRPLLDVCGVTCSCICVSCPTHVTYLDSLLYWWYPSWWNYPSYFLRSFKTVQNLFHNTWSPEVNLFPECTLCVSPFDVWLYYPQSYTLKAIYDTWHLSESIEWCWCEYNTMPVIKYYYTSLQASVKYKLYNSLHTVT